jgi:hypothetical protein
VTSIETPKQSPPASPAYPPFDDPALAQAILQILEDPTRDRTMGGGRMFV